MTFRKVVLTIGMVATAAGIVFSDQPIDGQIVAGIVWLVVWGVLWFALNGGDL